MKIAICRVILNSFIMIFNKKSAVFWLLLLFIACAVLYNCVCIKILFSNLPVTSKAKNSIGLLLLGIPWHIPCSPFFQPLNLVITIWWFTLPCVARIQIFYDILHSQTLKRCMTFKWILCIKGLPDSSYIVLLYSRLLFQL